MEKYTAKEELKMKGFILEGAGLGTDCFELEVSPALEDSAVVGEKGNVSVNSR